MRNLHHKPTVSVIIPVYNAERYLAAAVTSVQQQSHQAFEIILINDGSTDTSLAIAQSFPPPVNVYTQTNQGVAVARNFGIGVSQGNLLAFLDADDCCPTYSR